ncbi:sugar phosphate isomerase/epimerase family protein [Herbiconiux ginsengi]|uniref:Inosose dehydratase n=1 Tax=Herbiconiux ginsengi TaxID=381665 RepID=A0A1H3K7V4_9MICO|nr:sugar phosphate isomerase/epimerase [Herbiconiux ginsengi]SDY47969.1 inosose dehydratase [Herbiconiux ginsengi]
MSRRERLAINPLPFLLEGSGLDLSPERLRATFTDIARAGYTAVHADVPPGLTPRAYGALLESYGLRPAPGYFGGFFDRPDERDDVVEDARRHAAAAAELGLDAMFIAQHMCDARRARPAIGVEPSAERVEIMADGLELAAQAARAEGVTAALHPHVGSWIETEFEVRGVLDRSQGGALMFGPDTGHLAFAGMDAVALVADYRDRVAAIHLKDLDTMAAARVLEEGASYFDATRDHRVWAEPGAGALDLVAVLDALPTDFAGWHVVEVDLPKHGTPFDSAVLSRHNLLALPYFAKEAS